MGDITQGGEWPYQIGVFWFYCRFFVSVCLLWKLLKTICITWWIPRGTAHNFFSWRSLVELGENGLWTWLPNIFLKFGVSLVVILTHLEICTGSLDNRFKKPLALSFQNTPWKTDLKMNFLRNFHLKKKLLCTLVSVLTLIGIVSAHYQVYKKVFQIRLPGSVLERQCQGLFKSVI